jgi:putative SOS response-associated peptidase YedK
MRWGLIPHWFNGEDPKEIAAMTLNSRIETASEKASFRSLIDRQRCIVPSTGFFEWKTVGKEKVPYFVFPKNDEVFSIAGLYDTWMDPVKGELKQTFSIITCEANPLMREIHNSKLRMPVMLDKALENDWLSGQLDHKKLAVPAPDSIMGAYEINKKVISSHHANTPEVLKPFDNGIYEQGSLF